MKCNPVVKQIERSLMIRERAISLTVLCTAIPFPYAGTPEEEGHIRLLADELAKAGFSPSEIASYIRDLTDRIYSAISRLPARRRGVSWFCKGTLRRLCPGIQIPNNRPSRGRVKG